MVNREVNMLIVLLKRFRHFINTSFIYILPRSVFFYEAGQVLQTHSFHLNGMMRDFISIEIANCLAGFYTTMIIVRIIMLGLN